jgi:muconolactone delta-isomerase
MAQFMVDIQLPTDPSDEFFALVPLQRAHIDKLLERGVVMGYSLSIDRLRLWIALNARNERDAVEILAAFPMFKFFEPTIHPLMFHNNSLMSLLKVSLN